MCGMWVCVCAFLIFFQANSFVVSTLFFVIHAYKKGFFFKKINMIGSRILPPKNFTNYSSAVLRCCTEVCSALVY